MKGADLFDPYKVGLTIWKRVINMIAENSVFKTFHDTTKFYDQGWLDMPQVLLSGQKEELYYKVTWNKLKNLDVSLLHIV